MRVIVGGRRTGKTMAMIQLSHFTGMPILTPSCITADYITRSAREMGLKIPKPIPFADAMKQRHRMDGQHRVLIDDLEACLIYMGISPECVTANEIEVFTQEVNDNADASKDAE